MYFSTALGSSVHTIGKLVGGSTPSLDYASTISVSSSTSTNTWYWVKAAVVGNRFYYKHWADGDAEPHWMQVAVDDEIDGLSGNNWVGMYSRTSGSVDVDVSYFGVGTGADAADAVADEVGLRTTQSAVQVVNKLDATARITQSLAQTVNKLDADAQVSHSAVLALWGDVSESMQISQSALLVLATGNPCSTRWAQTWVITRSDGQVFRFTTLDVDLTWRGYTYLTCGGLSPTASEDTVGLAETGSVEVNAIINSSHIKDEELLAGWFEGATVEAWNVPWESGSTDAPFRVFYGEIGKIEKGSVGFKADIVSQAAIAQQRNMLDVYSPSCRHQLGDSLCTVNTGALSVSGTVTSVTVPTTPGLSRKRVVIDSGRSEDNDYFAFGVLTWTTGENAGQSHQVESFSGSTITLWDACAYRIEVGDQYTLIPGCDKKGDTCKNKFSNYVNFGGFPTIPGKDELLGWRPKATEVR
jgi:uncharacterized phage protein (TIGR02218 family)